jgi:soluble lytic murein transglycosylase-like protein
MHVVAALFAFFLAALCAVPASAETTTAPTPEATMAAVMRSFNPQLTLAKARAYARSVMADAYRTHLDPKFIMSIVTVESHWHANAVSRVGAQGLGQLMPGTAARLGVNPHNPSENLRGTSNYLKSLVNHFAGNPNALKLAIAGYNAGPKAVERFHGIPPYAETQRYVAKVLHVWNQLNVRVGNAFANRPVEHVAATRTRTTPDERQWLSGATTVLPESAPVSGGPDQAGSAEAIDAGVAAPPAAPSR